MESFQHTFRNKQLAIFNDDVLNRTFELENNEYTFILHPSETTKFWRFGIALSTTKDFDFNPNTGRYNNNELRYLEIDVGEMSNEVWQSPNKIALGSYYIEEFKSKPKVKPGYSQGSPVRVNLKSDPSNRVYFSYRTEKVTDSRRFTIPEYKYFKIFAWADTIEFEIFCQGQIKETSEEKRKPDDPKAKTKIIIETDPKVCITDDLKPVIDAEQLALEIGELLKLLRDPTGNMFGIFGRWGRGKTFLWKQIWGYLSENNKTLPEFKKVEFHAWKYQDTPGSWAYLYETLADSYFDRKNNKITFFKKVALNFIRKGFWPLIRFILSLFIVLVWVFAVPISWKLGWINYAIAGIGIIGLIQLIYLYMVFKPKAINVLNMYSEKISFQKYLGLQAEIQKEIIFLMKCWIPKKQIGKKKVLLFVDDIDRCNETKIIQVVDALKVMLEDSEIANRMIVIAALDERVLKMAINVKYYELVMKSSALDLKSNTDLNVSTKEYLDTLTKEYIDKIFISGIKLGNLSAEEKSMILESISENKIAKEPVPASEIAVQTPSATNGKAVSIIEEQIEYMGQEGGAMSLDKDINELEFELLNKALMSYIEASPRGIRIYYYRYLLAKKVMKYKLKNKQDIYKKWINLDRKRIVLPLLIVHFSMTVNSKEIENEIESLKKLTSSKIEKTFLKTSFVLDVDLYSELLRVIEVVVPY